jgi:hypothetical protein
MRLGSGRSLLLVAKQTAADELDEAHFWLAAGLRCIALIDPKIAPFSS